MLAPYTFFHYFQDVVHHGKKLKREKQDAATVSVQRTKGIKSLSKESREKLESYQNLFYLLQVSFTPRSVVFPALI